MRVRVNQACDRGAPPRFLSHNVIAFCTRFRSWVLHVFLTMYSVFYSVDNFFPRQVRQRYGLGGLGMSW